MKSQFLHRVLLTFFSVIVLGLCLYPGNVNALTLTPVRFEVRGDPGDVLTEEVLLINEGVDIETYYPSYSNFEAQGESGTPAFVDPKDGLGTWITTEESAIRITPGQQKLVPFKITIPKNAEPGGHFAVMFWGDSPAKGGGQVSIGSKTGILILLSVNGDVREEAGLLNFNTKDNQFFYNTLPVSFEYRFKNDGGDRVKPQGVVKILNTLFLPTERLDANPAEGNILPGSTRKFTLDWLNHERPTDYIVPANFAKKFWSNVSYQWKNFAVGLYSAHLNLAYGSQNQHAKETVFFFVFPWQLVLVMLIVLLIVFFGGKIIIKRYNKWIIDKAKAGMKFPPNSSHV